YCLTPKSNLSDLIYLTGLLNSRLLSFWFKKTFVATDKLFPYVRKSQLELVPISTNLSYKEKIVSLVINQQEEFSDDTQKQIDDLVYKLYGLLPEEIKIIEAVIY
ncbi:MAG: TaqI-like C-terminal specificity domain-containing protein, partial [bacterium]